MNETRLERLLNLIQVQNVHRSLPVPLRICLVCPEALDVDGAGVSLVSQSSHRSLGASDEIARAIETAQVEVREGPCLDAYQSRHPALETDLRSPSAHERWPRFSPVASAVGARAVFGFPLLVDDAPIGALDLYCRDARPLTDSNIDDALILAEMTALAIRTSEDAHQSGVLNLTEPEQAWAHLAVVHHASGMSAVQLGITVDEALLRMRAFAFVANRSVADVAGDIVQKRLRLEAWNHG